MPVLREVKVNRNSIEWSKVSLFDNCGSLRLSIPRREYKAFSETGYCIDKVTVYFKKQKQHDQKGHGSINDEQK